MSLLLEAIKSLGVNNFSVDDNNPTEDGFNSSYREYNKQGEVSLEVGESTITWDEVKVKYDILKAEWDDKKYQRERQYPPIGEQLDMQYWDKKNGTKNWEDAIDKVKADNPK